MQKHNHKAPGSMTTNTLSYCALLAALSVVLARLLIPMPNESTRFSIEAVPIFISGMLFGPVAGGLVGFAADFIGCLFSPFGFNPLFCLPPILYGLTAGLFRRFLAKDVSILRLLAIFLIPVVLGSLLWQSTTLAIVYGGSKGFKASFIYYLTTRSIQFAVVTVLDVVIIYFLFQVRIFHRLGVWPPKQSTKSERKFFHEC